MQFMEKALWMSKHTKSSLLFSTGNLSLNDVSWLCRQVKTDIYKNQNNALEQTTLYNAEYREHT